AFLGTWYLCSGLRFDFREDLERMDAIRAWPLSPNLVFIATLLPEVVLVSLLLVVTMLVDALVSGGPAPFVLGMALCLPPAVLGWVALDNAIFLFAPVRFVPGQDSLLQNAGRGSLVMCLRLIVALLIGVAGLGAFMVVYSLLLGLLRSSADVAQAGGFAALFLVLCASDVGLVLLGGKMLERFDVARDRG